MISIFLNNKVVKLKNNCLLINLIEENLNHQDCFAIMLNRQFIARTYYKTTLLSDGDIIDVIVPMQGG